MTNHEQKMCEAQSEFFELSIDNFSCSSALFISRFMNSDIAKELDNVDDCYNFISPNNLIYVMKNQYDSLTTTSGNKYPRTVLKWIGYIYRAWALIKKRSSSSIYKDIPANKMVSLYDAFHTLSVENCVDRLEEISNQDKPKNDDYQIFKQIMLSK